MKANILAFSAVNITIFLSSQISVWAFPKFATAAYLKERQRTHHINILERKSFEVLNVHRTVVNRDTRLQSLSPTMAKGMAAAYFLRGGAESALNLAQESYHMQSLAAYSTVTALIMNACLRLYSSTKFPCKSEPNEEKFINFLDNIFISVTSLCIISGIFTAVLFNILGIYRKSALGMGNNEGYLAFKLATQSYSRLGFRSFLTTCMSFLASFNLSLYSRILGRDDCKNEKFILMASVALELISIYYIREVIKLASALVFAP